MSAQDNKIGQKEKIQILLAEYSGLRGEITSRTGYGFQVGAATLIAITWLFQQPNLASLKVWIAVLIIAAGVALFAWVNVRDIWKAAARLRELEHEINSRAGQHLLVWERLSGAANKGFLEGIPSKNETLPKSKLPPLDPSYQEEA
jgi:hypothetical protein